MSQFKPYQPSLTVVELSQKLGMSQNKIIKLNTGENPSVVDLLPKVTFKKQQFSNYPDPKSKELRLALAKYTDFPPEYLLCGNGSDELIDLLIRAFVDPQEEIITCPPTFAMYEFYGQLAAAKIIKILRTKKLEINLKKVISSISDQTKIVFVDSPGNPAGTLVNQQDLKKLCQQNCLVVVDEAYYEYASKTATELIRKYPNLIVLRTLSKWAGLAGLRLGYMIANPSVIQIINSIKSPYNVNSYAQIVATKLLGNVQPILNRLRQLTQKRDLTIKQLKKCKNIEVYPSKSAYIIFKARNNLTKNLNDFLLKKGVVLKKINQPLLENCLRCNLGTTTETTKLLNLIQK